MGRLWIVVVGLLTAIACGDSEPSDLLLGAGWDSGPAQPPPSGYDSGANQIDAGPPAPTDAGGPLLDAGSPPVDAGSPPTPDGGISVADGSSPMQDAGGPTVADSGASNCAAEDAQGVSSAMACGTTIPQSFGFAWNGTECVAVTGCRCDGAACGSLAATLAECWISRASCFGGPALDAGTPPSCAPQSATASPVLGVCADGTAPRLFGYAWDGRSCTPVAGCSCEGADCASLPSDPAACAAQFSGCGGSPPPDAGIGWWPDSGVLWPDSGMGGGAGCTPLGPDTCGPDQFCRTPLSSVCGFTGTATGECVPRPTSCPPTPISPVCGCDGVIYNSICEAEMAGQSVASFGSCGF